MNVNFEAIEKAWFKPKKTVSDELEEWLKNFSTNEFDYNFLVVRISDILDKIQELKKKVK